VVPGLATELFRMAAGLFPKGGPSCSHFLFSYQGSCCLLQHPHQGFGRIPDKKLDQITLTLNLSYRNISSDITPEIQYVEVNHESCMNPISSIMNLAIAFKIKIPLGDAYKFTPKLEDTYF
jgi:hypothetical protein